ncbi:MAG: TetR/AcrR family transcriptional regulator [Clostridia bacterium]|nr:TetR/AcrR family transcriptional regulator [Clostridia bacterium]
MNFTDLRILRTEERLQNALLELLKTRELKTITVKELCDNAGISRNAFYQHYRYKEDLYDQMVASATERIRGALSPIIEDPSHQTEDTIYSYARNIVDGIDEVKELIAVMARGDEGTFLRQLTDLLFEQILHDAIPFFGVEDSAALRLFYEYGAAGMAAFIIKWAQDSALSKKEAVELLAVILLQGHARLPEQLK